MTEDLRALLRADLHAESPPPIGDVVGAALRDGRRLRRHRRFGLLGSAVVVLAVLAGGVLIIRREPAMLSPQSVPNATAAPVAALQARTLTVHSGTVRADGTRTKATSAAMLHLLTQLLPPGRTSHYEVAPDDDLLVQLYLDDGQGPGLVRVAVAKTAGASSPRGGVARVTIRFDAADCRATTTVDAEWPDGTVVEVGVPTCLPGNVPARPALTADEAVRVATDPRWGVTMDQRLVAGGAKRFPRVPVLGR